MIISPALTSGAAGAVALNLVHEAARHSIPEAPHVQRIAMRAIARPMRRLGRTPPDEERLYLWAMAGDLISNTLYYSLVGLGQSRRPVARGLVLGLAGGLGALALPGPMGLGSKPVARTPATKVMTAASYTLGGLTAAVAFRSLRRRS